MGWIGGYFVEIDDGVEVAWLSDPLIDGKAVSFIDWRGMKVVRTNVRKNGCAIDLDSVGVCAQDDLLVGPDHLLDQRIMFRLRSFSFARELAEIVDSLKNNYVTDTGLCQDVAVHSRQCIWTEPLSEKVVPANAMIQHR